MRITRECSFIHESPSDSVHTIGFELGICLSYLDSRLPKKRMISRHSAISSHRPHPPDQSPVNPGSVIENVSIQAQEASYIVGQAYVNR